MNKFKEEKIVENKKIELNWDDVFKISSGKDVDGNTRSAAGIYLDKILNSTELENIKEVFLRDAIINIHVDGAVAIVTADFPPISHVAFTESQKAIAQYFQTLNEIEDFNQQLTMTVTPYALEGQIIIIFNHLIFSDGYERKEKHGKIYRLLLIFQNEATEGIVTDKINYNQISQQINTELERYEAQVDAELQEAIEEEKKAKQELNDFDKRMEEHFSNPFSEKYEKRNNENIREDEESSNFRFTDDDI